MVNTLELNKQREIAFDTEPAGQLSKAFLLLSGLTGCTVEYSETPNTLRISYSLADYTLEGLEHALIEEGFTLDHSSLLKSIERKIIYYCEDTICHNMDIPTHPTKMNERNVFAKAYEQESHGDQDDTPPELRDCK